jgi:ferredoxin-NADP reductase/fatty acid desaturase
MTITANPSVRQVLAQVVRDPAYPSVTRKPVLSWPHIGLVALAYGIFGATTVGYLTGKVPFLLMVLLNQFAIYVSFTPLHDAVHEAASRNVRLNNLIGTVSAFLFVPGLSTTIYRILHMEHHRWVGDEDRDPDMLFVDAPKWILWLVLMTPEWIWTHWYITKLWRKRPPYERAMFVLTLAIYVGIQAAFLISPVRLQFVLCWLIPQKIATIVLVYFFAHIQHPEEASWEEAPFQTTVSIRTGPMGKVYWLGQTDHCLHHALPHVPFHRYHLLWELGDSVLTRQGIPERGYFRGPEFIELPRRAYDTVRTARVVERREVGGAGIATFVLEGIEEPLPPFTPGSHIDVHLPSGRVRQYSMIDPASDHYQIAVKPEPAGRGGSLEVHEHLQVGTEVTISVPRNNFELTHADRYVLVAGGIGITPLLSMAHHLWAWRTPFALHVCAQDADSVPFRDELRTLPFAEAIEVHLDATPGRTSLAPASDLGDWEGGAELYVCGPAGFMDWIRDRAVERGWPLASIHRESFSAPVYDITEERPFDVVLARQGLRLNVPPGRQILDVLAEHNILVPWACSQGVCGTCVTAVLDGEPEHRDAVLSPEVRKTNTAMCLCVSRAKSERVVLDL